MKLELFAKAFTFPQIENVVLCVRTDKGECAVIGRLEDYKIYSDAFVVEMFALNSLIFLILKGVDVWA